MPIRNPVVVSGFSRTPDVSGKIPRHAFRALAVEPESIDDRAIASESEQARFRVTGLGLRRDGADLGEAKSERGPGRNRRALLVEPGGESEGIAELEAEHLLGQSTVALASLDPAAR